MSYKVGENKRLIMKMPRNLRFFTRKKKKFKISPQNLNLRKLNMRTRLPTIKKSFLPFLSTCRRT